MELYRLIFESETAVQAGLGGVTAGQHWEAVRNALRLSPEAFRSLPREFFAGDRVDGELVDFLRAQRPARKTALLSNAWDNLRSVLYEDWKIADAFDDIVISAEVRLAKPDERIYRLAVERLGVDAGQAVFVDDVPENVAAARSAGLASIHFRTTRQTLSELEELLNGHD
jgi:HAD superfamily hydrolase (TIGR01509 family)